MYTLTLGGELHLAPIKAPREILDVGTGTGIWAIQMADKFPEAQVTGTDLSPIQPDLVPENCVFEIDDNSLDWTWEDNQLDYVHVREMMGSIKDWDLFCSEALRCIAPGGYIEIMEHSTWPVRHFPHSAIILLLTNNIHLRSVMMTRWVMITSTTHGARPLATFPLSGERPSILGKRARLYWKRSALSMSSRNASNGQ